VQSLPSSQFTGCSVHTPLTHVFGLHGSVHVQAALLHEMQYALTDVCVQFPPEQASLVQGFASSQFTAVCLHPVAESQLSIVQASESAQEIAVNEHFPVDETHESVVHKLLSLHVTLL